MCANLKQVLSWEIKKIDLLKLWIYGTAFDLCVTGRAGIYVWDAGPVWGRPDSVRWAGCFVHTVHPLLCCRKYVLHLCYICITYNSSGVTYWKPTFILCKKFGKSLIVVNISHHKQVFDKYMYLFVAKNIHYFFPKIVS